MSDKSFMRVRWLHTSSEYPVELWSELDPARNEVRKVEIWADGRVGYASARSEHGGTRLGEIALPTFEEIAADPEFDPQIVTASEFEDCWARNVR